MKIASEENNKGKMILIATILASGMSISVAITIIIALPTIQAEFGVDINKIQWVINGYVLAVAVLTLVGGFLGDHFGRKRIFMYGVIVFTISSSLSALSQSIEQLILFQVMLGLGAAMMIPSALAIINVSFAKEYRGRAIGLWAGISGAVAAIGPLFGGWLVETLGWQYLFWFNVPFGFLVYLIAKKHVEESYNPDARKLDWLGSLLIVVALLAIVFVLIQGPFLGWNSYQIVYSFIIGGIAFFIFVVVETFVSHPLIPFKIFKEPIVVGSNIVTFLLYFAVSGAIFFLVFNFQQVQEYSPTQIGLALLPPAVLIALFSGLAGSLSDRIGPRIQMIVGPLVVSGGMVLLAFSGINANYFTNFLPGLILLGAGMAIIIAPLTKGALRVEDKFSGVASGVNIGISRIAILMAVAILGAVVISFFTNGIEERIIKLPITKEEQQIILAQKEKIGGIEIPESFNSFSRKHVKNSVAQSFMDGFRWVMIINAILAFVASIVSFFEIKNSQKDIYTKKRNEIH